MKKATPFPEQPRDTGNTDTSLTAKQAHLSPRQARLLRALLQAPLMREAADRITGASNSPDWIMRLRRLGLVIHCERILRTDRDGKTCWPGRYSLAPESLPKALRLLGALDG